MVKFMVKNEKKIFQKISNHLKMLKIQDQIKPQKIVKNHFKIENIDFKDDMKKHIIIAYL